MEFVSASIALSWTNSTGWRSAKRSTARSTSCRPTLMRGSPNTTSNCPAGRWCFRSARSRGSTAAAVRPYRKLARSGKPANVITAAIARELARFIWPSLGACRRRRVERTTRDSIAARRRAASYPTRRRRAGLECSRGQEDPRDHYLPARRSDAGRYTEAAPRRIDGHAVSTRPSEYDQPSPRRSRLLPCPPKLKAAASKWSHEFMGLPLENADIRVKT